MISLLFIFKFSYYKHHLGWIWKIISSCGLQLLILGKPGRGHARCLLYPPTCCRDPVCSRVIQGLNQAHLLLARKSPWRTNFGTQRDEDSERFAENKKFLILLVFDYDQLISNFKIPSGCKKPACSRRVMCRKQRLVPCSLSLLPKQIPCGGTPLKTLISFFLPVSS